MEVLQKETYLAMIKNAVGSKLFQTVMVKNGEEVRNVVNQGDLACAFFVSTILKQFDLLSAPHVTVVGTVKDMEANGWTLTNELKEGVVIVWEEQAQADDEVHKHIGFYIGNDRAISNSYKERVPVEHQIVFNDARRIEALYTHTFLA